MIRQVDFARVKKFFATLLILILLLSCSDTPKDPSGEELREKAHQAYGEERYDDAFALYQEACQKNDGESCFFASNRFSIPNEQKRNFYESSCSLGYDRGCLLLGFYHSMNPKTQSISQALAYFSKSCDLGNEVACRIYKRGVEIR